jgi:hypothetical protein
MDARRVWRRVFVAGAMSAACAAHADEPEPACRADLPQGNPIAEREGTIFSLQQMPESCLKSLFIECSHAAGERILDLGSAAFCSMGYEALLSKGFGGNFHALLGWWRRERDQGRAQ